MGLGRIATFASPVPTTAAAASIEASLVLSQRCVGRPMGRGSGRASVAGAPIVSLALRSHRQEWIRRSRLIYRGCGTQPVVAFLVQSMKRKVLKLSLRATLDAKHAVDAKSRKRAGLGVVVANSCWRYRQRRRWIMGRKRKRATGKRRENANLPIGEQAQLRLLFRAPR